MWDKKIYYQYKKSRCDYEPFIHDEKAVKYDA